MRYDLMANSPWPSGWRAFVILLVLGASITACERAPQRAPDTPAATTSPTPPASPPSASTVTEGAKSSETANANDQPMKSMTKAEESTSMPQPGQANDDSTVAKDSKK
jgi:hypothetical protein